MPLWSRNRLNDEEAKRKSKVGLPPGTPVHTGIDRTEPVTIEIVEFNESQMREYSADCMDDCAPSLDQTATKWVHVNGVHKIDAIENIGQIYDLHPLVLEDIPSTGQRPKVEFLSNCIHVVLRQFDFNERDERISSEQVSVIMGERFVLSFQETAKNLFQTVRNRLRHPVGRIRKGGPDYLAYALLDLIVDNYFLVMEQLGERIERLEDQLVEKSSVEMLGQIHRLKRSVLLLRRHIWPSREVVSQINRAETTFIQEATLIYLRDLYDHVIRVADLVETYRETITGMLEIYLSSVSNRMNEVMQALTVISTIFIPLTLMSSIYGMNYIEGLDLILFQSYPVFVLTMIVITILLLWYFRKIHWI